MALKLRIRRVLFPHPLGPRSDEFPIVRAQICLVERDNFLSLAPEHLTDVQAFKDPFLQSAAGIFGKAPRRARYDILYPC